MKPFIKSLLEKMGRYLQRSPIPLEDILIRIIISTRLNFLISYTHIHFSSGISKIFPKLGLVLFSIHARHNWSFYYQWYKLTTSAQENIVVPIKNGRFVEENLFVFVIRSIQSPALIHSLLKIYSSLSKQQQEVLLSRVHEILRELTIENRLLFCKQLIFLSVIEKNSTEILVIIMELINSENTDLLCTIQNCHRLVSNVPESQVFNNYRIETVLIDQNSSISREGKYFFASRPPVITHENFHKFNFFFCHDDLNAVHIRKKTSSLSDRKSIKDAILILSNSEIDKYSDFLFHLECLCFSRKNLGAKEIIISHFVEVELEKFLASSYLFTTHFLSKNNFYIENLNILENKKNERYAASSELKDFILNDMKIDKNKFKNKIIALTSTLPLLSEEERHKLQIFLKAQDGIFIDIEITSLQDILSLYVNAESIISGEHPILAFNFLRSCPNSVYILKASDSKEMYEHENVFSRIADLEIKWNFDFNQTEIS